MSVTTKTAHSIMEIKANLPAREVCGYAATWDPDEVDDKIVPTAFNRTLEERHNKPLHEKGRSDIRILWQHEGQQPLGVLMSAYPDEKGLLVKIRISRTQKGDEILQLLADGAIDRMSIGYMVKKSRQGAGGLRILEDVDLWEISFVTFPANTAAVVTGVKRVDGSGLPDLEFRAQTFMLTKGDEDMQTNLELKAGRVLAGRNMDKLKAMMNRCKEVMDDCKAMLHEAGEDMDGDMDNSRHEKAAMPRTQDAGGRGQAPSNHTAERDARKGRCPNCDHELEYASDIGPYDVPDPKPHSIAGLLPHMGQPDPKPESIAGYPGPYEIPDPRPESIAASGQYMGSESTDASDYAAVANMDSGKIQAMPLPPEMTADLLPGVVDLVNLAEGGDQSRSGIGGYTSPAVTAPGYRPGGPGPYTVPGARPYSIASSAKEPNTSSSNGVYQLAEELKSMRSRLSQI
jgi:HK97 family phage prohead protease